MTEELIYLIIFTQAFPESTILIENRRIGWCRFFGALHPVNQSIFSNVHSFIKDLPELFFVPFWFKSDPREIDRHNTKIHPARIDFDAIFILPSLKERTAAHRNLEGAC